MPFDELDFVMISALEHFQFCPRQCALIHVEGSWAENTQTAEGRVLHERVHQAPSETVGDVRVARKLRLASRELGLAGVADVVEFHPLPAAGVEVPGLPGRWRPYPVEYKRGRRKAEMAYFVQLCAQALCLEEMLGAEVPAGALYHCKSRRRQVVEFDLALRKHTCHLTRQLHDLIASGRSPPPQPGPKCRFCSLADLCVPRLPPSRSARAYLVQNVQAILAEEGRTA